MSELRFEQILSARGNDNMSNEDTTKGYVLEWVRDNSDRYELLTYLTKSEKSPFATRAGQVRQLYLDAAYAMINVDDEIVIAIVPRIQFAPVMADKHDSILAGEYTTNKQVTIETDSDDPSVKIYGFDHRERVTLDDLNHIIDLNRPDVLDPWGIFNNQYDYMTVATEWAKHGLINENEYQQIKSLPEMRSDLISEALVQKVADHPRFRAMLYDWRSDNWISELQARHYAKTKEPIVTIHDELSFAIEIGG